MTDNQRQGQNWAIGLIPEYGMVYVALITPWCQGYGSDGSHMLFCESALGGALTKAYLDFACSNRSVIEVHDSGRGLLMVLKGNHGLASWQTFLTELQAD